MPCIKIVVHRKHGKWMVRSAEPDGVLLPERKAAAKAAIELAHQSGKDGKPAQVVMQNGKSFETIWT